MPALFDPTTFSPEQAAILNNTPGKSLSETNTPEQISAAQAITPQSLERTSEFPLYSPSGTKPYPVSTLMTPLTETPQEMKVSGLTSKLSTLYESLRGKSAEQTAANTKFGVDEAQKNITDLGAQLTALKNEAAAIPLQMEQNLAGKGTVLTGGFNTQQNSRLRTNAIAALGVSSLLAASQGQLANAQSLADRAVAQKYDPILEEISIITKNLELIKSDPKTTLEEKNRAQKQIETQNAKKEEIELASKNASEIWKIATEAATQSNGFKPTPEFPSLAATLQKISQAKTKEEALTIALKTGLVKTDSNNSKILGSASTGYFTVDDEGKVTPLKGAPAPNPKAPKSDFSAVTGYLQAQAIPTKVANKDGSMALSYKRKLLDGGMSDAVANWLWEALITGNSLEAIRQEIRKNGSDPKVLDTFVTTLQA